ncbi:hypothetical protein COT42_07215 [Candidatus Saganbacteria bacterium CG08_land_8_20_14_0_20_45_16]|uniref:Uncharacterized protein n=1 Tax=Candidatus Saganbacteria bacterium CG08_land_8_20_14_0_20_45_16 TaxID=2014293 RepID=A0A2H0XUT1_UNCSA|nr:MAG: hypothetical protein COT42_07215 [Candidatus Saganbacteria bacterium CG08_land_8_20_14_0_20_45_16]
MPIRVCLGPQGGLIPNQKRILDLLKQHKEQLRSLPLGKTVEVAVPKMELRYNRITIGNATQDALVDNVDHELRKLGIISITRTRNKTGALDDKIIFDNGALSTVNKIVAYATELATAGDTHKLQLLLHLIYTTASSGPSTDFQEATNKTFQAINKALEQLIVATGYSGSLGLMATGNFGAFVLMPILCHIMDATASVLGGGFGTRQMGHEQYKGNIWLGLFRLNVCMALTTILYDSFLPRVPKGREHKWTFANDNPVISCGELTEGGRMLSEVGSVVKDDLREIVWANNIDQVWTKLIALGLIEEFIDEKTGLTRGLVTNEFKSELDFSHKDVYKNEFKRLVSLPTTQQPPAPATPIPPLTLSNDIIDNLYVAIKDVGKVKGMYFVGSPHDPNQFPVIKVDARGIPIDGTERLGMAYVLIEAMGEVVASTEKIGGHLTEQVGKAILAARGLRTANGRRLINWYAGALDKEMAFALHEALSTHMSGLTVDQAGDGDTYSNLFAAATFDTPEQFAQAISNQGLAKELLEDIADNVLFPALQKAMYRTVSLTVNGVTYERKVPKFAFAELNYGGMAIDVGTLEALFSVFNDMVRSYQATHDGETRTKILQSIQELERMGIKANLAQAHQLEAEAANAERVRQALTQGLGGMDPTLPLEQCEFPPVYSYEMAPRIAVREDPLPSSIRERRFSSLTLENLQGLIACDATDNQELWECRQIKQSDGTYERAYTRHDPQKDISATPGELLYIYDRDRIVSTKAFRCRFLPKARLTPGTVGLYSQIGNGTNTVSLPANGVVIESNITASISHQAAAQEQEETTYNALRQIALKAEKGELSESERTYKVNLPNGWTAQFKRISTQDALDFAEHFHQAADQLLGQYYSQVKTHYAKSEFSDNNLTTFYEEVTKFLNVNPPTADENTQIKWLNQQLQEYQLLPTCQSQAITLTPEIYQLIQATNAYYGQNIDFATLSDVQQRHIELLNRLLLEQAIKTGPAVKAKVSVANELKGVDHILNSLRRRAGLEARGLLIPINTNKGINRVAGNLGGVNFGDGSSTHLFELSFAHQGSDAYIVSNAEIDTPQVITEPTLFTQRMPANGSVQTYQAGFGDDPGKDKKPVLGKRTIKDLTSSGELACERLFVWRTNQELATKEMLNKLTQAVILQLKLLPFIKDMSVEAAKNAFEKLDVNDTAIKDAIKNALEKNQAAITANVEGALVQEIVEQTPHILGQYIHYALAAIGVNKTVQEIENILAAMKPTSQEDEKSVSEFVNQIIPKTDTSSEASQARGLIRKIVHNYPVAEMFFADAKSGTFSITDVFEKLVKFHRIQPISLMPKLDDSKLISHPSPTNQRAQIVDDTKEFALNDLDTMTLISQPTA